MDVKIHSQVTSVFMFDLCHRALKNTNIKCEHNHLLPWNPFMTFDANESAAVTCEQGLRIGFILQIQGVATI